MEQKAKKGKFISKPPKGYKLINKELTIFPEQAKEVQRIFQEFLNTDISLSKLAKKHNLSTPGIKKLLKNTTYIGKVKFKSQQSKGNHKPIISKDLFDRVQKKLK
jgi:DNA invertase Pin-like site-specific DNA recombinase